MIEIRTIPGRIFVMIWEATIFDNVGAECFECSTNGRGPTNPREQSNATIAQCLDEHRSFAIERNDSGGTTRRTNDFVPFVCEGPHDLVARKGHGWRRIDAKAAVYDAEPVGMPERSSTFAQGSRRKQTLIPESGHSVDAYDVEITGQSMMLKTVVENQDLRVEGRNGMVPHDPSIAADQDGNTRRMRSQNEGLVSCMRDVRMDMHSV